MKSLQEQLDELKNPYEALIKLSSTIPEIPRKYLVGREDLVLKLIMSLEKAIEQRNDWILDEYPKDIAIKHINNENQELAKILSGEKE